ncbi:hypothetical protein [Paracoccus tibetensis]|uniref:Uncharacterized protein n=1 Tax=Paracoccus tibetensis TaxID=336292 RepID=A0A1G5B7L3_9RHOB|nr:hypothetical protein [Paracoccus tibetensis]SCX86168.1 hypothetical protein SAMN05660710_00031 [Paracoccus tibetensis]
MSEETIIAPDLRPARRRALPEGLVRRMQGPGGYYNIGNILAFTVSAALAIRAGQGAEAPGGLLPAIREFLIGSPSATAISVAMLIFFVSGEAYFRAWRQPGGPSIGAIRLGDGLSAVAAIFLCVSLVLIGNAALGIASTLLLLGGKLGSALRPDASLILRLGGLPAFDPFRLAVVASRLPALIGVGAGLLAGDAPAAVLTQQATLLVCYALWLRADLMLSRLRAA